MSKKPTYDEPGKSARELEQVELDSKQTEEELAEIFSMSLDMICIADINTATFIKVNPAFTEILGHSEETLLDRPFLDFVHPDDIDATRTVIEQKLQSGARVINFENRYRCLDGSYRWLSWVSHPNPERGITYAIARDITERIQVEKSLRESEKQFRHFFEHLTIGVAVYEAVEDGNDFLFFEMNPVGQKLSKVSIEEVRGKSLTQIFPSARKLGLLKALQDTWRTGQPSHVPLSKYTDNRITQWVENRVFRIPSGRVVAIYDDRTEFMRLEEGLRKAQKMESIGNLAGGIAHDFNNILSSIIGFTELAIDETPKGTTLEDYLQEIYSAGKRAKDLVKQILAFARQSDEKASAIQPGMVAKEVLNFIRSTIPATIKIQQKIESDSWILGNGTQVHQVLMNLCTNATHAMEDSGGILDVSIKDRVFDKGDSSIGPRQEKYIEIKISDTGMGIAPEIIGSIFEPYFTTKGLGEGTGMGLAMAQGVVDSYGGKITVDSQLGKGTTFTILLPITKKRSGSTSFASEKLPSGTERILLVDDEASIAKMGSQILERLGYSVTTRTGSLEALELFRVKPDDFDLVVTDMTMPNLTGDKLAVELMKIRPDIPIILCTGYSKKIANDTASDIGIKAFAYKPVVRTDLAKTVRKVLDEARSESKG